MERLQAYKYELMPDGEQARDMRRFAGSCRYVYNKALALQIANHQAGHMFIGYVAMARQLTEWRNSKATPWLKDAPCHPLQHALKDLDRAYTNFFAKRADFPRFKRKGCGDAFRYPDPKQIKFDQANGRIFLPKLGWLRYRHSRDALGELRNATVSLSGGKWFVSIQTRRDVPTPVPQVETAIGIDVGVTNFAALSDGTLIAPLNSFKKHEQRLARYQRRMSRKVKFSKNWNKAKARVQKVHRQIANARKDYLHKLSTAISKSHAICFVEDLNVKNMSKSAKGSVEAPGTKVAQKRGLNRAILDQGWGEFIRQLDYKLAWQGGMLIAVPPQYTSCTCPCCAHVGTENRRTQAAFVCVRCGYANHADIVGAINILERGHRSIVCGERAQSGRSKKQKPAEVTTQGNA